MKAEEIKSAVITVLKSFKEDYVNNPLMRSDYKEQAINRIERAIQGYERGFITAHEALEMGINPLKNTT